MDATALNVVCTHCLIGFKRTVKYINNNKRMPEAHYENWHKSFIFFYLIKVLFVNKIHTQVTHLFIKTKWQTWDWFLFICFLFSQNADKPNKIPVKNKSSTRSLGSAVKHPVGKACGVVAF